MSNDLVKNRETYGRWYNYVFLNREFEFRTFKPSSLKRVYKDRLIRVQGIVTGFCGKIYCGLRLIYSIDEHKREDKFIWDKDEITEFIQQLKGQRFSIRQGILKPKDLMRETEQLSWLRNVFYKYNTPYFFFHSSSYTRVSGIIVNHDLKRQQFFKVFDTFSAYQEIDMFLNNQLVDVTQPQTPVGGDKVIAAARGHDGKYSFKQEPGKKKRKKRKKEK
jgi:hypothetical protein